MKYFEGFRVCSLGEWFYTEDYQWFSQDYGPDLWESQVITILRQRLWQAHILNDYYPTDSWEVAQSYRWFGMQEDYYCSQ